MVSRHLLSLKSAMLLCGLCGLSCSSSEDAGRPDSELGNLVISPPSVVLKVDLDRASHDASALLAAVLLPHSWITEKLGAHVVTGTSSVTVTEDKAIIESLSDTLFLKVDEDSHFRATLDNSKEYGRHAIFDGTRLYLRPRFGLYHARAPQSESEAAEIGNEMAGGAGDTLSLFSRHLKAINAGTKERDGRSVREIILERSSASLAIPLETIKQRLWRNRIEVLDLRGRVALDSQTGAALFIQIEGSIRFDRDGRQFVMKMQAERSIGEIGNSRRVAPPQEDEILEIPARRREVAERNSLLKNIAPPARSATAPPPSAMQEEGQ